MSKENDRSLSLTKIETKLFWKDLVIKSSKLKEVKKLEDWLNGNSELIGNDNNHLTLFHGPPGTGKTLTASLLGKYTNKDVYRVDLSMVVSKYIGETEKNLQKLFDSIKNKDCIIFFDEADSFFSKRTNVKDANDKYANQEISYLLQRIEHHNGLFILSSNLKIDNIFTIAFDTIIEFKKMSFIQKKMIWLRNLFLY